MEGPERLLGLLAMDAGITAKRAKVALYLVGLARDGRTTEYAANALRRKRDNIKTYAREFMIDFADYRPFAKDRDKGAQIEPRTSLKADRL